MQRNISKACSPISLIIFTQNHQSPYFPCDTVLCESRGVTDIALLKWVFHLALGCSSKLLASAAWYRCSYIDTVTHAAWLRVMARCVPTLKLLKCEKVHLRINKIASAEHLEITDKQKTVMHFLNYLILQRIAFQSLTSLFIYIVGITLDLLCILFCHLAITIISYYY